MTDVQKDKLMQQVLNQLDAGVQYMDGATASRLRQARATAIEKGLSGKIRPWLGWAISGAALAPVIVLSVILLLQPSAHMPSEVLGIDDINILVEQDDVDFFEELEFYRWMNSQQLG